METKICTKCGVEYPATKEYFYVRKERKSGLGCTCVKCIRERDKLYRKNNSEKFKEKGKKWRDENPEKVRQYQKDYVEKNRDKIKENRGKYREINPEKIKAKRKRLFEKNPDIHIRRGVKRRLEKQIGAHPPPELVEIKVLINKTKRLCKTLKN